MGTPRVGCRRHERWEKNTGGNPFDIATVEDTEFLKGVERPGEIVKGLENNSGEMQLPELRKI